MCAGLTQTEIAGCVEVHKSTISRELRRNAILHRYTPEDAHRQALTKRERSARNASKFQDIDWEEADRLIKLDWSP